MRTRQKCVATDTWRSLGCRTTPLEHWSRRKPTVEPRWAKQQTKKLRPKPTKINSTGAKVLHRCYYISDYISGAKVLHRKYNRCKSIVPIIFPLSITFSHLSIKFIRAVLQEWFLRNPDWYLWTKSYLFKYANKCIVTYFAMLFDKIESMEIGL